MYQRVAVDRMLVEHVVVALLKELGPGLVAVFLDERHKSCRYALFLRYTRQTLGALPIHAALRKAELTQQEERLAWQCRNPVRVASSRIQHRTHHAANALVGKFNQTVLELKRTYFLHLLLKGTDLAVVIQIMAHNVWFVVINVNYLLLSSRQSIATRDLFSHGLRDLSSFQSSR